MYLKIVLDTDSHGRRPLMSDWIKKAAEGLKARQSFANTELERNKLNADAIKRHGPRIWTEIKSGVECAVNEFNREFADTGMPDPVYIDSGHDRPQITLRS